MSFAISAHLFPSLCCAPRKISNSWSAHASLFTLGSSWFFHRVRHWHIGHEVRQRLGNEQRTPYLLPVPRVVGHYIRIVKLLRDQRPRLRACRNSEKIFQRNSKSVGCRRVDNKQKPPPTMRLQLGEELRLLKALYGTKQGASRWSKLMV